MCSNERQFQVSHLTVATKCGHSQVANQKLSIKLLKGSRESGEWNMLSPSGMLTQLTEAV